MPKTRRGWKKYEELVAALLGGKRIPVTGRTGRGEDPGDVELAGWYVEVRDREHPLPSAWFAEAAAEAGVKGVKPLLVYKIAGSQLGPVAILRLKDLAEVLTRAQRAGDPGQAAPGADPSPFTPDPGGAGGDGGARRRPGTP